MTTLFAHRHGLDCYVSAEGEEPTPKAIPARRAGSRGGPFVTRTVDTALELRKQWMREMGLSEEEIWENCQPEYGPFSLEEEAANLAALENVKRLTPPYSALKALADRTAPSEKARQRPSD